jgi:hydroxymethylpyrimidine pyrophosphatase-like HAD family hydrolase
MAGKVRLVGADKDGTIVVPRRLGEQNLHHADEAAALLRNYHNVYLSILTGQSREESGEVVRRVGANGISAYEMGGIMAAPGNRKSYRLSSVDHCGDIEADEALKRWASHLDAMEGEIRSEALKRGIKGVKRLRDKELIISYEVGDNKGKEFQALMNELVPQEVRKLLDEERIRTMNPGYAVDFMPSYVGKRPALHYIMSRYCAKPEEVLVAIDSGHSDLEMMEVVIESGYAACPADSTPEICQAVAGLGDRGYVSQLKCRDGAFPDILRYAEANWGFA